ncbi:hypothetical protein LPB67_01750 [Undibacterium sp. Jales W-56]|uniref:hypothetical protein n=1 Tax=Undibacterium sp. Jales W-56 TaxID=2897325 RepID=UPI0021D2BD08|nr:hypothetical protein [Undibacterium sp. Jales W-56]MCU6432501.1 hypothetical protein [Undibacterium sp. Jales W-56]
MDKASTRQDTTSGQLHGKTRKRAQTTGVARKLQVNPERRLKNDAVAVVLSRFNLLQHSVIFLFSGITE